MADCNFQAGTSEQTVISCVHPQMRKTPRVPRQFCESCRYHSSGVGGIRVSGLGDVVKVGLEGFGITQSRVKKITKLFNIEDCNCEGRRAALNELFPMWRDPKPADTLHFVWCYWAGGQIEDEIRWSIRSIEAMFQGDAKITIVGDRPNWYTGHHIHKPRIGPTQYRGFRDMMSKMEFISTCEDISESFCWMMDDIYAINPITLCMMETPKAERSGVPTTNPNGSWYKLKIKTLKALQDRSLTTYDYATHLPHVVERTKLRDLWKEFKLNEPNNTMLWELLYGNSYYSDPCSCFPFLYRTLVPETPARFTEARKTSFILNHGNRAWNSELRDWLKNIFPEPSSVELS